MLALVDAVLAGEAGADRVLRDALMEREQRRVDVYADKPILLARTMLAAVGEAEARRLVGGQLLAWADGLETDEDAGDVALDLEALDDSQVGQLERLRDAVARLPGLERLASHLAEGAGYRPFVRAWCELVRYGLRRLIENEPTGPVIAALNIAEQRWVHTEPGIDPMVTCGELLRDVAAGHELTGDLARARWHDLPLDATALARAAARRLDERA